jgi:hypothetical protein
MKSRSVLTSAPVVAGFALFALVLGAIFGVRAAMNNDGDTEVAGTVIERSEVPEATEDATERIVQEPVRLRPRPDRRPPTPAPVPAPAPAPVDVAVVDPAAGEQVDGPVGLIRDEPSAEPRSPRPEPKPEPRPTPEPEPEPKPTTSPEPEDTSRYDLHTGKGLSRDTAEALQAGNSGNWNWQFKTLSGHGQQDPDTRRSREPMARLEVGFNEEARTSNDQVRDFRCDALLTAGSQRLITDTNHVFELSLWTTDGYSLLKKVDTLLIRQALDLEAGEQQTLYSNVYELDAADGVSYTCQVRYIRR